MGTESLSLKILADRIEIQETLTRYATALDTHNLKLFDEVFAEDAVLDYRSAGGVRGNYKEVRDWLQESMAVFHSWQHLLSNMVITIQGDSASARTDVYNPLASKDENGVMAVLHIGAYYTDRLVRTPAGWRILERTLGMVWVDGAGPASVPTQQIFRP
jgi:hypothetical protein